MLGLRLCSVDTKTNWVASLQTLFSIYIKALNKTVFFLIIGFNDFVLPKNVMCYIVHLKVNGQHIFTVVERIASIPSKIKLIWVSDSILIVCLTRYMALFNPSNILLICFVVVSHQRSTLHLMIDWLIFYYRKFGPKQFHNL